jgi:hypothetical protein
VLTYDSQPNQQNEYQLLALLFFIAIFSATPKKYYCQHKKSFTKMYTLSISSTLLMGEIPQTNPLKYG